MDRFHVFKVEGFECAERFSLVDADSIYQAIDIACADAKVVQCLGHPHGKEEVLQFIDRCVYRVALGTFGGDLLIDARQIIDFGVNGLDSEI